MLVVAWFAANKLLFRFGLRPGSLLPGEAFQLFQKKRPAKVAEKFGLEECPVMTRDKKTSGSWHTQNFAKTRRSAQRAGNVF